MARHSSPSGRHVLETRPAPAHRRIAADPGSHRARTVATRGRGTAATLAGGALSIAGATAAGWVAANHLPSLLDVVLKTDAAPAARTVALIAQNSPVAPNSPDAEAAAKPPATVDPAAVAASATRTAAAPTPASRPAAPAAPTSSATAQSSADTDPDDDSDRGTRSNSSESDSNESGSSESDSNGSESSGSDSGEASSDDSDSDANSATTSDSGSDSNSSSSADARSSSADARSSSGGGSSSAQAASLPLAPRGAVTGNLPSDILDTKDWYLTLPTGKEGSPDLVEGSALARYHSQFFDLTPAKDAVVFTAATNGATTSGSQYPRSELREMVGSDKASWDGRKGRHTMEIVEAITETPKEKPDVIAGQIHGTTDDLMQIHLSGNRLRVKYADGQKFVDLDPNYKLGTMFAVKIESAGGRVKVWYNGQQKADLPISSSTSYFKAGVYTNSNPSKGDKSGEGQVVIRSLSVRHE